MNRSPREGNDLDLGIPKGPVPHGGGRSLRAAQAMALAASAVFLLALWEAKTDGRVPPRWVLAATLWYACALLTTFAAWARRSRQVFVHFAVGLLFGPFALGSSYLLYVARDLRDRRRWSLIRALPTSPWGGSGAGPIRRVDTPHRTKAPDSDDALDDDEEKGPPPTFH